ncbi:MAG TPA: ATP-binding protein [Patescibacteria group bacterium]|nr:ATP-binding protein [Patescibacteria group bacterium]
MKKNLKNHAGVAVLIGVACLAYLVFLFAGDLQNNPILLIYLLLASFIAFIVFVFSLSRKVGKLEDQLKATNKDEEVQVSGKTGELATEKAKFNIILNSINDGVFIVDRELKIRFWNKAAAEISGFSDEEVVGKPFYEVVKVASENTSEDSSHIAKDELLSEIRKKMDRHTLLVRKDGEQVSVDNSAVTLTDESGVSTGAVVIFRDVSHENELQRVKDTFISVAAHHLRTPLGTIRWNLEMIQKGDYGPVPNELHDPLKQIAESDLNLIGIVNELLDVSRINQRKIEIKWEDVYFAPIIKKVAADIEIMARQKNINIHIAVPDNISKLRIDTNLFYKIIENLLSNAIKYSRDGGNIEIDVEEREKTVRISIKDAGIGISQSDQKRIFEKFYRADNAIKSGVEGTGMGMFVVKSYMDLFGGEVSFESQENVGTTILLDFPKISVQN